MPGTTRRTRKTIISVLTGLLAVGGLLALGAEPAAAAPAPVLDATASGFTADRLPTVQIDGVAWSQVVVGNTVYVGGRFNNARPAGAAAGTNLTPRGNLLAYDITTGNLVTSFAPTLNGQVLSVAASPDGTRIYVAGDFTTANGQARRRVAAYSTANGQLISTFNPSGPNSQARAVIATNDTVYVGGGFQGLANGTLRNNLVAYRASDGAVLPWNPNATGSASDATATVWAVAVSADGASVFAGGSFQNVGGQPAYGLAKVSGSGAGAIDTTWQPSVRNAGKDAGISSLRVQAGNLYGTTWHFGPGGNLEGSFKIPVSTSDVTWVTDCHGDNYSAYLNDGVVYTAGHAHYCGNMGGGFPQYSTWQFQHAQAWSDTVTGDILNDVHGYPNWHGVEPGPAMVNWLPDMAIGSFTGQYQAGWNVTGNNDYLAYGGEFPRVNGVGQQGLVRFAKRSLAGNPKAEGPRFAATPFAPRLVPTSTTALRVSWPAAWDRDDQTLTYKAIRTGVSTPRHQVDVKSQWWNLPQLGFTDTGLTPGATYSYRIVVNDAGGNTVNGSTVSVTMPTTAPASTAYANKVRTDGARIYWPLNETSGTTVTDRAAASGSAPNVGVTDGRADTGVTWNQPGAITGDSAASLGDNDWSRVFAGNCAATAGCNWGTETAPDTFTSQVWVKTGTTNGGRILGFGDLQNGGSGHRDRHLYMDNAGRLVFGVRGQDNSPRTVSSARSYNDDQWHMVTATMSGQGMALYVDGVRVGRRSDTTEGESYLGYWRLGGDNLDGWPSRPNANNFVGAVDEVAIYPTALTQAQVLAQFEASGRTSVIPPAPADTYGAAVYADEPDLYWRFAETDGTKALDSGKSLNDGTYRNGVSLGAAGRIAGNAAASFAGDDDLVSSDAQVSNPTVYSEEVWFKTTSTAGGKIIGFGDNPAGTSGSYDRHVIMFNDGRLMFGVWTGFANVIETPSAYNDGGWHHVVASQGPGGMKLYVDGVLVGTNPQVNAQPYSGYWKVGGDTTWGGTSSNYLSGTLDEAAIYSYELSAARVSAHFSAGGGVLNQDPTAAFTSATNQRRAAFDAAGSADPDGTIVRYDWDFGDDSTGSGATPAHVYGASGTYAVKLTVTDNKGGKGTVTRSVTIAAPAGPSDAYGKAVYADQPRLYYRLGENSGTVAADASGGLSDGTYYNGYTLGRSGALVVADTAAGFDGNNGFVSSDESFANPSVYSEEAWFKTSTTRGGKIIGFGSNRTGSSGSYDRHVYMGDDGRLVFGTYTGQLNTITSTAAYNNDQWHHVVATQSGNGMRLYVDGELVGTNPQTQAEGYTGYWKIGGDNTWGSSSAYFDGTIDEAAVYLSELSATRVAAHYAAAAPVPNQKPTARFTVDATNLAVATDASQSSDPDGTVTGYAWKWGDGATGTGKTANHTYTQAGTFTIELTVTDDAGASDVLTKAVTVTAANQPPTASFTTSVTNLKVDADAGSSTDPDGTIATYAWKFGDGKTGTGQTPSHTYDEPGEYSIELTVTDDDGATNVQTKSVTVTAPPNLKPTAAFTSTSSALAASFNASTSTDQDGTIASYAWSFGDNTSGSGVSPNHTYGQAGTYAVQLTVTDDDGATNVQTKSVTVTAPPNLKPTAAFTSTSSALAASFNASTSTDQDGTIASYAWSFGDNTSGSGVSPNHTYGQAGTYAVQLTVTDDDGATDSVTRQVTVTAPAALATDSFNRTVVDGWGSASPGGAWTISGGAANFDVANGVGTIQTATGAGPAAYLNGVSARDVELTTQFSYDKPGTGGGVYTSVVARRVGTSDYRLKFRATGTATTAQLVRMVNNVETILATQTIPGVIAAGDSVNVRLQAQGSGTTTLRAKVWVKGAAEPAAWGLTTTDTTASLQNPGSVGLYNYLSGSSTNGPSTLQVADFEARSLP